MAPRGRGLIVCAPAVVTASSVRERQNVRFMGGIVGESANDHETGATTTTCYRRRDRQLRANGRAAEGTRAAAARRSRANVREVLRIEVLRDERPELAGLLWPEQPLNARGDLDQEIDRSLATFAIDRVRGVLVVLVRHFGKTLRDRRPDRVETDRVPAVQRGDAVRLDTRQLHRVG